MFTLLGTDGKEYGPVTAGTVIAWIRDGRANLQTKARLDRENVWKTLGDFAEFNARPPTAVPSAPPVLVAEPEAESPAAAVELVPASRWLRLPAAMIDGLLKSLCYLPITIPLVRAVFAAALSGEQRTFGEISQLTSTIVNDNLPRALPLLVALMLVQLGLLAWRSQSIGKLLLGLRIVREQDGGPPGVVRAFLIRGSLPFMIEQIPFVGFVFWVVDSCYIFRDDHRCLHDLFAGTRVVPV
jgi:uncharacterized RDD family membrane protein YckC